MVQFHSHHSHFPASPMHLPRTPHSKIWVSVLNSWSNRVKQVSFPNPPAPPHKSYLSISKKTFWIIWTKQPVFFPLASFTELFETLWCKDSAGGRNCHGKNHHKQLESAWVIRNWKKTCIKENVWQPQQQKMLRSFAKNKKGKEREKW